MDIDQAIFLAVKAYNCLNENFPILEDRPNPNLILDMSTVRLSSCDNRVHFDIIIPEDFGIFSSIISSANISCFSETFGEGQIWTVVTLTYRHPGGGQNGSEIGQFWMDGDNISAIRKPGKDAVLFPKQRIC